ncbi:hypothetical protein B0H17DRAFT_978040 [Mycena rosella]|uniref:Tetratricopeptide SHNi-TPR domain-containing protein n=1 Tax=Mycena rosella TaxID=1033263 RepID=A0AAD7DU93_MYCRO|nr:hypothetical protein B0H17DRAFT_978040 [Mycena rosella]
MTSDTPITDVSPEMGLDAAIEHAQRAFALEKYEQAVDFYATALELMTKKCGEDAPETADLYYSYGKALLENAIAQSSVLGKDQPEDEEEADESAGNAPILSFSGDAEDAEDTAVDLREMADEEEEVAAANEEEEEDAEPEDDFNAAWEVLDLARAIYAKQTEDAAADEAVQLKLADTYIALGDVSLETEKFSQAITDYEAALALKGALLPRSSRQIAEAHYKLSMVLDLTSGRLGDAITHAEKALESIECRLAELAANPPTDAPAPDPKGKGKGKSRADGTGGMSAAQIEAETKELAGLKEDLAIKVDELKTRPDEPLKNASALVAQALDAELNANGAGGANGNAQVVNDLTSMVVKKKKKVVSESAPAAAGSSSPTKRKADDEGEGGGAEGKKVRVGEP